jgi:transcription antitermination factor NusG
MLDCITPADLETISPSDHTPKRTAPSWLAVYVKHRHEKAVTGHLQKSGYEAFLPLYMKNRQDSKHSHLPLFPGYVFCRSQIDRLLPILKTPGVFTLVGFNNTAASIPDHEIEGLKLLLRSGLRLEPWKYVAPGEQIRLKAGPLRGLEGVVLEAGHEKWVVLSVHLLQRSVAVKVDRSLL